MQTWLIILGVFLLLIFIQILLRSGSPVRRTMVGILVGLFALLAVNLTGIFTGVTLPLSVLSIGVSATAGIPGVTLLLLLNMIVV